MNLKEIQNELSKFNGTLSKLQDFDFFAQILGINDLTNEEQQKVMKIKNDPNFVSLIKNKASKEEIESYIKTVL